MGLITMNCAHGHYAGKCTSKHCGCFCHTAPERLEYLRGQIEAEQISYSEISELQSLAEFIEPGDVQLLQWAGVPEFD